MCYGALWVKYANYKTAEIIRFSQIRIKWPSLSEPQFFWKHECIALIVIRACLVIKSGLTDEEIKKPGDL